MISILLIHQEICVVARRKNRATFQEKKDSVHDHKMVYLRIVNPSGKVVGVQAISYGDAKRFLHSVDQFATTREKKAYFRVRVPGF